MSKNQQKHSFGFLEHSLHKLMILPTFWKSISKMKINLIHTARRLKKFSSLRFSKHFWSDQFKHKTFLQKFSNLSSKTIKLQFHCSTMLLFTIEHSKIIRMKWKKDSQLWKSRWQNTNNRSLMSLLNKISILWEWFTNKKRINSSKTTNTSSQCETKN